MRNILKHYSGTQSGTPVSLKKSLNFDKIEKIMKKEEVMRLENTNQNSFTRSALRFIITFYSQFQ